MYLAKHVGGWSLPKIGRFYNGRHHTTVLHAIAKVERLRKTDETFDSLLDILTDTLAATSNNCGLATRASPAHSELIDAVALRVIDRLKELPMNGKTQEIQAALITEIQSGARAGVDGRG
jgi:Bacterial dnaA protein helix-turn-helix